MVWAVCLAMAGIGLRLQGGAAGRVAATSAFAAATSISSASSASWAAPGCKRAILTRVVGANRLRGGSLFPDWFQRKERLGKYSPYASERHLAHLEENEKVSKVTLLFGLCDLATENMEDGRLELHESDLNIISKCLNEITPEEFGFPPSRDDGKPIIDYVDIFEEKNFTACMFKLPAGYRLPMHDHPGMYVWSKVLWGEMEVSSYDRESPQEPRRKKTFPSLPSQALDLRPFKVNTKRDREVWKSEDGVKITTPTEGNIHEFRAVTNCCFVDVIMPPYDFTKERRCTYYEINEKEDGTWARPIRCPPDYITRSLKYIGDAVEIQS